MQESAYKRSNKILFSIITIGILTILLFTNYATMKFISVQNLDFKNDIIKITPYVEDAIIKQLKSDWARMINEEEFQKIKKYLETIKK